MSLKKYKSKPLRVLNQEVCFIIKLRCPVSAESDFAYKHLRYTYIISSCRNQRKGLQKPVILSTIKMPLFIWKSSQFYFWTETSLLWLRYITSKGDILLQCLLTWELGKLHCWRGNKDMSFLKSGPERFSLHLVFDINTDKCTCCQFCANFLVRIQEYWG